MRNTQNRSLYRQEQQSKPSPHKFHRHEECCKLSFYAPDRKIRSYTYQDLQTLHQQELKEFLGSAYNDYNLVIALDNGNPVESRIVRDRFQRLCEENDYEVVVFHSLRHLSTGYKLKMTNGDVKSVQGDTGHAEAEMVTDVYSEIIDEDRRFNAQKMDKEFYSTLNDDTNNPTQDTAVTDSDMALLELIKSLSPEMKEQFLKQALQR